MSKDEKKITLYTAGLFSKWGFGDGDILSDFMYDTDNLYRVNEHKLLFRLVRKFVLPVLNYKVEVCYVKTIHNPVRAEMVDGEDYSNWYEDDHWDKDIEPKRIDISYDDALEEVNSLKDKQNEKKIVYNRTRDGQVKKGLVMSKISEGYSKFGTIIDFEDINSLLGQLLTYVDATYSDLEQRNAHKSVVKKLVCDWYYSCEEYMPVFVRGEFMDSVPEPKKETLTFGLWERNKFSHTY